MTARGLRLIEDEIARADAAVSAGQVAGNKGAVARAARDMRYWAARRQSAELVETVADDGLARFGMLVTVEDDAGRSRTFRIVGQDESDPGKGLISYVAPLAAGAIGRSVGDVIEIDQGAFEITAIAF